MEALSWAVTGRWKYLVMVAIAEVEEISVEEEEEKLEFLEED